MEKLSTPSHCSITLKPSSFICKASLDDPKVDNDGDGPFWVENTITSCSLCSKGFPIKDVVMASCGYNYQPWCIITQNWISKSCAVDNCKIKFTSEWKKNMGVFNCHDMHSIQKLCLANCSLNFL